jgi:hypothetical protein
LDTDYTRRRALWPRVAYGGLDRQRNDRLGWHWILRCREHRRQILRASGSIAYTYAYSNCVAHTYSNPNAHANADTMHGQMCTNAEATSDARAPADAVV